MNMNMAIWPVLTCDRKFPTVEIMIADRPCYEAFLHDFLACTVLDSISQCNMVPKKSQNKHQCKNNVQSGNEGNKICRARMVKMF